MKDEIERVKKLIKRMKKFLVTLLTICLMLNLLSTTAFASTVNSENVKTDNVSSGDATGGTVSGNDQIEVPQVGLFRMLRRALPQNVEVTDLRLLEKIDGTPDFNTDDEPGHDSSADNGILRTLDVVTYNLRMAIQVPENPAREGDTDKVMIKSVIPGVKKGEVQFLTDSMSWLYEPVVTETTEGLTLTGYTMLDTTEENVYWQDMAFSVKAFAMEQGRKFAPQFSAWVEGQAVPAVITEGTEVTVSAKEGLNISVLFSEDGKRGYFDFSMDSTKKEEQFGYLFGLSLRAELMAEGNSLKGVLIPDGDISFDINLRVWDSTDASVGTVDATQDHIPLIWDYTQSRTGEEKVGELGRVLDGLANGMSILPYGEYNEEYPDRCVYDSGELTVVQEGTVLHVTIHDYDFGESVVFPEKTQNGNTFSTNQGVFSSGLIQLLVPYEDIPDSLLYTLEATISEIKLNGQVTDQMSVSDDKATRQIQTVSGSWNQMLIISHMDEFKDADAYVDLGVNAYDSRLQGDGYAYPGEKLVLTGTFCYPQNNQKWNGSDYLMKVPNAIELPEIEDIKVYFTTRNRVNLLYPKSENLFDNVKIRYAAKADGSYWVSESEMDDAFITDLVYYDSKEAAAEADAEILGLLFECRSGKTIIEKYRLLYVVPVTISEDAKVGYVYPLTFEANQYQINVDDTEEGMTTQHGVAHIGGTDLDVVNTRIKALFDDIDRRFGKNGNNTFIYSRSIESGVGGNYYCTMPHRYVKSEYENGQVKAGSHVAMTSDGARLGLFAGNSLLIVDTQASIDKSVEQLGADGKPRSVFNLNENQREVDYILKPDYRFPVEYRLQEETDTLTITDTLDKGLTYIAGSSFQGGEYNTATEELTGGVSLEPVVTKDGSGRQVLTWTLENVKAGEDIDPIHYSCSIDAGVKDGTQLSNTAKITAPSDSRPVSTDTGKVSVASIQVIQSRGAVLNKTVNKEYIELVDEIEYTIKFTNNGNNTYQDILLKDILPYDGDGRGTDLKGGTYEVISIEVDGGTDVKLYATTMAQSDMTTAEEMYTKPEKWNGWTEVGADTNIGKVTAIACRGDVEAGQTLNIKIKMKINCLLTRSVLFNNVEAYTSDHQQLTTIKVRTIVLPRMISGLAWLDADKDGIRDDAEELLSGIKVTLLDESGNRAKDIWGNTVAAATTDENGAYSFDNLPKGKYQVIFENGIYKLDKLKVSAKNAADATTETDSDAVADYTGEVLKSAIIADIELPELEDIVEEDLDVLESAHWDLGLFMDKYYSITVNYCDKENGEKIVASYQSGEILGGSIYDMTDKDAIAIEGYTYDSTDGDALSGIMDSDKVINVYYVKKTVEVPKDDDPKEDEPTTPSEPDESEDTQQPEEPENSVEPDDSDDEVSDDLVEIEDPSVPHAGTPDYSNLVTLDDPMVPLTKTPKTGDSITTWFTMFALTSAGLAAGILINRKRRKEEE